MESTQIPLPELPAVRQSSQLLEEDAKLAALEKQAAPLNPSSESEDTVLHGVKLVLVFGSCLASCFQFALDQSIVATAIPQIVSHFQAFEQIAWIITAYFLTQVGLILLAGQLLTLVIPKYVLLGALFVFELGSLIAGVAPSMNALIVGRAVQGIGSAALFVSILSTITMITTLQQRPAYLASFGGIFVISSIVGPLLGGVFTQHLTWRWCFYINLPFGGLSALFVAVVLPAKRPAGIKAHEKGWKGLLDLDYIGSALVMAGITCLLLALQWGGSQYAWSNWRIGFLFGMSVFILSGFALWEYKLDTKALLPLALLKDRSLIAACVMVFGLFSVMLGGTYQLPLFYQATRHQTPTQSGISILVFMLSVCVGVGISGAAVGKTGRYKPFLLIGPPLSLVGNALLYTLTVDTPNSRILGFQFLCGFGIGICFQLALISVQANFNDRQSLIPQATGLVSFAQLAGAAIGIGIVNTVQSIYLSRELKQHAPGSDIDQLRSSPAEIYRLPESEQAGAILAYTIAISKSFLPILLCCAISWIAAFFIKGHNMKKMNIEPGAAI